MSKIKSIKARQILDSRGFPTVEVDVLLADGSFARAAVPSGASTGSHEALELRDGGKAYMGKGVTKAVNNVNTKIAKKLQGMDASKFADIDRAMLDLDGTANKSKLGANAILGVSMGVLRAASVSAKMPLYQYIRKAFNIKAKDIMLPAPMLNIINGGQHADSGLDVQEFMIVPVGCKTFAQAMQRASEVYHQLKKLLASKGMVVSVGDEGGFAPHIKKHEDVLKTIMLAVKAAGYTDKEIKIALDCAASEFYRNGKYKFEGKLRTSKEMTAIYAGWVKKYPIISIEDPFFEDDWEGFSHMTKQLGKKIRIVGDDLFVTNPVRVVKGIKEHAANAVLIKLNQIGSVSETMGVIKATQDAGFTAVISHRSGETEDTFIADLSVAVNAGAIKTGAPCRTERLCKYNQLLRIEDELGKKAVYAKDKTFKQ